ncbi:MAG: hypothetical protein V8R26_04270 [Clostridia bacterium]|nr:hypothetical protein [Clostridiaceae bacterium]
MHKILSFYNSNRRVIWIAILAIAFTIILLQTLNNDAKKRNSEINTNDEINSSSNTTIYPNNQEDFLSSNYNSEKIQDEKLKLISAFLEKCNNGKIKEAYDLLSTDCKEEMFPVLEKFKNDYTDLVFNTAKTYDIKLWMSGKYSIYKISIYENALATGVVNNNAIDSYYTVVEENNDYKININNLIAKEELNTENSNDYVRINVISRKIYIDYEEYEIKITNNTQKTILMDGYRKNNSMYLQDSVGGKKTAYTNEIPERLLIINPLLSITRTIKFNKSYTEKISSKGITFEDIILDYDEYKKQENKQEYSNVSNINVGF